MLATSPRRGRRTSTRATRCRESRLCCDDDDVTEPRRLADRYELGEPAGFGGMAEVFRAYDTRLHRDVAVKVLRTDLARDPQFHARFRREAKNAAALNQVDPGRVVGTDPPADAVAGRDDEVTINLSVGPAQKRVPPVSGLTPDAAEQALKDAGFEQIRRAAGVSGPEAVGKVMDSVPAAGTLSAVTNPVTIMVGGGPGSTQVPVVARDYASAERVLQAAGFTNIVRVDVDSTAPIGEVVDTNPSAGQTVPFDSLVQVQVSLGNQFSMQSLIGLVWDDGTPASAQSQLKALGWTGTMFRSADTPNSGQRANTVVTQNPAPGLPVAKNVTITLSFAP